MAFFTSPPQRQRGCSISDTEFSLLDGIRTSEPESADVLKNVCESAVVIELLSLHSALA